MLLIKNDDGTVRHARPGWFPTKGKGVVFLDELNRAHPDVLNALFSFALNGTLHTHKLPKGWKVVAAGNYNNEMFNVTDTSDQAFNSRFCHIDFKPTVEEWLIYAENHGALGMTDFIREQPSMLELTGKSTSLDTSFIKPDRRSCLKAGMLDESGELAKNVEYEVYSGMMGPVSAAAFMAFKTKKEKSLTLRDIVVDYKKKAKDKIRTLTADPKVVRLDLLNQPIDELVAKLEDNSRFLTSGEYLENFKSYLLDIPRELSMKAIARLGSIKSFSGKDAILNDPDYVKNFRKK